MNIFNQPSYEQKERELEKIDIQNTLLASIASHAGTGGISVKSWEDLQRLVRMGLHEKMFVEGDQLISAYDTGQVIWDIVGINHDIPSDKRYKNSLTLQTHDCIMNCQFDAPEALYYAETELPAGEQIFTLNNLKYKFATTQVIPIGGQVYVTSWSGDTYIPTKITTYGADRITAIEQSIDVVSVESGTNTLITVNHAGRCRYGSNNYKESAVKQWLNSNSAIFAWTPKTNFDRPPSESPFTGGGFLKLLDPELVSVLGEVDKQVARNIVTDEGGQDLFSDKVFLLSRIEVFGGTEGVTTGENPYPYYSAMVANPTSGPVAGRVKCVSSPNSSWWLRSPHVGSSNGLRFVYTTGSVYEYYGNAYGGYGVAPACCIV